MAGTRVKLLNVRDAFKDIIAEKEKTKKKAIKAIADATIAALTAMIANTPVWSGTAVANYGVAIGKTGRRSQAATPGGVISPRNRKAEIAAYGKTNQQGLGGERQRSGAQQGVLSTVASQFASMKDLQTVTIFNSSPAEEWEAINNAQWPGGKGQRVRNQAVVVTLGEQVARKILESAK